MLLKRTKEKESTKVKEQFNFDTSGKNVIKQHNYNLIDINENVSDNIPTDYHPQIFTKDRKISDIYDQLVQPKVHSIDKPIEAIKIDGKKKPAYNDQHTLELNNWNYYENENFINGGSFDGLYAYDPNDKNYNAL